MVRGKGSMRDKKKVRFCCKITDIITELQFTMRAHRFVMFETIKTRSVVSNRAPAQHQARCGMVKKSPKEGRRGGGGPPTCAGHLTASLATVNTSPPNPSLQPDTIPTPQKCAQLLSHWSKYFRCINIVQF